MSTRPLCVALVWAGLGTSAWCAPPVCPETTDMQVQALVGRWQIEWHDGKRQLTEGSWVLALGPHPEYAGSLKGMLSQGRQHHPVAADWDEDALTMEESEDGVHIAATWQATATAGQCGRELQGLRFTGSEPDASAQRFRMRKLP